MKVFTATTLAAVAVAMTSHAQERWDDSLKGFYANAGVGVNILSDISATSGGVTGKLKMDVGERISLSVGYMVPLARTTSIGLEFDTGALVNALDKRTLTSGGMTVTDNFNGYYYQLPFLANGVLVCHAVPRWAFFVGGGAGGVYSRLHVHRVNGVRVDSDSEETDGAVQGMAGAKFQINPWSEVGIAYKYLGVFVKDTDMVSNHAVMGTYTFHF